MSILNLTQHPATTDQIDSGVVDLAPKSKQELSGLLTVSYGDELQPKIDGIIALSRGYNFVMLGGAPFLMAALERAFHARGVTVLYAFSERQSVETVGENGEVTKRAVFKHVGFYTSEGLFEE